MGDCPFISGKELGELAGIFLVTSLGAKLFSRVYVEWNYNLWGRICLHMLMNLSREMFSAGDTALGDGYSNTFRAVTITLIIVLTIFYKKGNGKFLSLNKSTILIK